MIVSTFVASVLFALSAVAIPTALEKRDSSYASSYSSSSNAGKSLIIEFVIGLLQSSAGLMPLCPGLNTMDRGCIRYTSGFDVTGVVTEVDLTFPQVQNVCDCIQECLNRSGTCTSYVYKFSTPESVMSGHRTCTLYSQFNLPANVTLEFNLNSTSNMNINAPEIMKNGNNPQAGSLVPQAFMDINLNTTADPDAVSGPIWQLQNGQAQC